MPHQSRREPEPRDTCARHALPPNLAEPPAATASLEPTMRAAICLSAALLLAATTLATPPPAQPLPPDPDLPAISDLVTASRILANEGILDSFGHVSARSSRNPEHFFIPRAMPPALVTRDDIVEVGLDCKP